MTSHWQPLSQSLLRKIPPVISGWMTESYILTKHLKMVGNWNMQLIQNWQQDDTTETWQRHIVHHLDQKPLIYAEVSMPNETHRAYEKQFGELGQKPLGETLLYHNDAVTRGPFEFMQLTETDLLFQNAFLYLKNKNLWARRSTFYWKNHPLTIVEIFVTDMPPFKPRSLGDRLMSNVRARFTDYCHLIRLHRPIPILLMLWPTLWGLWIASNGIPTLKYLLIFIAGVVIMRSAGDVFNDLADRNFDGFIERTKMRPLATGRISVKAALIFACILCLLAFGLVLLLNKLCILLAFIGLAIAIAYPFMKRITHFPQVVLGVAYNWGIVMAFAAVQNHIPWQAWYLLGVTVIWTVAYDTMYALADKKDDLKQGIKSTAVIFGNHTHFWIGFLQALTFIGLLTFGLLQHLHWAFYLCLILTLPFFIYQHTLLPDYQIKRCIAAFNNNHWIGLLILIGLALSLA